MRNDPLPIAITVSSHTNDAGAAPGESAGAAIEDAPVGTASETDRSTTGTADATTPETPEAAGDEAGSEGAPAEAGHGAAAPGDAPPAGDAPPRPRPALFEVRLDKEIHPTKVIVTPVKGLNLPIPEAQLRLLDAIETLDRDLDCIFDPNGSGRAPELGLFVRELKVIAQIGLEDASPRVDLAFAKLESLKLDILARQAGPHRIRTLRRLGKYATVVAGAGAFLFLGAMAIFLGGGEELRARPILGEVDFMAIACTGLLVAGCAAGVWLSFLLRQPPVDYAELARRDQDLWGPRTKLVAAELLTLVLAITFQVGLVSVDLGPLDTASVFRVPLTALLIGLLCGISERVLSERVAPIAARFGGGTAGRTPRAGTPAAPPA